MKHAIYLMSAFSAMSLAPAAEAATMGPVTIRAIALEGDLAPGGGRYSRFGTPTVNNTGEIAFSGHANGSAGVFTSSARIASAGDPAPDGGPGVLRDFFLPDINDAGDVEYLSFLRGDGVDLSNIDGVYLNDDAMARRGGPAPGASAARVTGLSFARTNNRGDVVVRANGVEDGRNFVGVLTSSGFALRSGAPTPGVAGATFTNFLTTDINDFGEFAYAAQFAGPGVGLLNGTGIFAAGDLVARFGGRAPVDDDIRFGAFGEPVIDARGEVAFTSGFFVDGGSTRNDIALFGPSGLFLQSGDAAPGFGDAAFLSFVNPSLSDGGLLAFYASVTGPSIQPEFSERAIFSTDESGDLSLLVRKGDLIETGEALESFSIRTGNVINDLGQVAFTGVLDDGRSGVFVASRVFESDIVVAPLPASVTLLGVALLGLFGVGAGRRRA